MLLMRMIVAPGLIAGSPVIGLIVAIALLPAVHPWLHHMHEEH